MSIAVTPLRKFAAVFILMALAMRVIIPSGYMPASERGFALTICAGMDSQTVWMDKSGKLHKEDAVAGDCADRVEIDLPGQGMEAVQNEPDIGMIRSTHDFPGVTMVVDMPPPRESLISHLQAAAGGLGAHAGVGGEPVDEEQGEPLVRGAVGADVDVDHRHRDLRN